MAIRNKALTINILVLDTVNNRGKTGDAANISLKIIRDGAAPVSPSAGVTEPNATSMPGIYQVALTASEMNGDFVCVSGVSSTTGVIVYPVFIQTERGDLAVIQGLITAVKAKTDSLPADPAGESNATSNKNTLSALITAIKAKTDNLPADPAQESKATANKNELAALINGLDATITDTNDIVNDLNDNGVKLNTQGKADVNAEVADVINVDAMAELTGEPGATPSLSKAVMLHYMALRNKTENTASAMRIFNGAGSNAVAAATLDDSLDTFTKGALYTP